MNIRKITKDDRLWPQAWKLYTDSFPMHERRDEECHMNACGDPRFNMEIAEDGNGELLAILFYWPWEMSIFIEHFAVHPRKRGQNIGTDMLGAFLSRNEGHPVILEIEPPVDGESIKRLRFYERLGFVLNHHPYTHPSFGYGHGHELKIMSRPHAITEEVLDGFKMWMRKGPLVYVK